MMRVIQAMGPQLAEHERTPPLPCAFPRFVLQVLTGDSSVEFQVTDLQGNLAHADALMRFDSFHFEVLFSKPLAPELVPIINLGVSNSPGNYVTLFHLRRKHVVDAPEHAVIQPFESDEEAQDRVYQFFPGYNVFYASLDDLERDQPLGVEFSVHNTHIRLEKPELDPTWELGLDDDFHLKTVLPNYMGMERASPMNALYGRGFEPHERAQGMPFWYFWREGRCIRDPATRIYYLLDDDEYEENGGADKLKRCGGSGAYTGVGVIFGDYGKPFTSNPATRAGTNLESGVRAAVCLANPNAHMREAGWIDGERIDGFAPPVGMSPDGLISDSSMTWESVYAKRQESWAAEWASRGYSEQRIAEIKATLPSRGLFEAKVTTGQRVKERADGTKDVTMYPEADMSSYYIIQLTWNMMMYDLYWARLVKLNLFSGELRSYTVFRDFEREKKLIATLKLVRDKMREDGIDLPLAAACAEAKKFRGSMFGSAKWYCDNKDTCSQLLDTWDSLVVRGLFAWRRATRRACSTVEVDANPRQLDRIPSTMKERLAARLGAAPMVTLSAAGPTDERLESLRDAHRAVTAILESARNGDIAPDALNAAIMDNIAVLTRLRE